LTLPAATAASCAAFASSRAADLRDERRGEQLHVRRREQELREPAPVFVEGEHAGEDRGVERADVHAAPFRLLRHFVPRRLLRDVRRPLVLQQRDEDPDRLRVEVLRPHFGDAIDRDEPADRGLFQVARLAAGRGRERGLMRRLLLERGVMRRFLFRSPLRGELRGVRGRVLLLIELRAEHELQHRDGVVVAAVALQRAPVVDERQYARLDGRGRFAWRDAAPAQMRRACASSTYCAFSCAVMVTPEQKPPSVPSSIRPSANASTAALAIARSNDSIAFSFSSWNSVAATSAA
jgi:hypothetical protein